MGRASKRDALLKTATELFSRNGFVATGVNQITQEADIASMTLYNNFKNKDELILASLEKLSAQLIADIKEEIAPLQNAPKDSILKVFDYIDEWIKDGLKKQGGFSGCTFLKASIEFGNLAHPAHQSAISHKNSITQIFQGNLEALKIENSEEKALSLQLLLDGAITQAQLLADPKSAERAKKLALKILED